ncbi:MAG: alpha/beta hydrolase [Halofilum sp. (in: g-proteobacteria)]|nr:alpha/beta hydrolase [Halofilum sp. (in: g-proteobacteria)]
MSAALTTLAPIAGGCLAVAGLLWLLQPYLVFQPAAGGSGVTRTPADVGLEYEGVRLAAADEVTLAGWFVPHADPAAPVVLFLHGNAGNIGGRVESLQQLHEAGAAVLIIDYRGYGDSTGRPTEAGTYRDARAAWDWLTRARGMPPGRIVIFGRSLGGPIAAHLARAVRPAGLVLEFTFTSMPALAADLYPGSRRAG